MDDHDDHGHDESRPEYDPASPSPPDREPPLRSTAPQSPYTGGQVAVGAVIMLVGLAVVFGLPLAMA
jgi:hypothetical protein